jgi:hypothetical protein
MIKSYFLLAWRNLQKHKTSAAINIGGLALGLTTSILVLLFVVEEFGYDRFHRNIADLSARASSQAAGLITLLIALVTVGSQGLRTANANPAKKLRNE